jgi:KDO2-lipid IV(A) lauroyltransferase
VTGSALAAATAPPPAPPRWYRHGLNRVAAYRAAALAGAALPRRTRLALGRALGRALARALPAERGAVRRNLWRVLGGPDAATLDRAVAETFAQFGACFSDLVTLNRGAAGRLPAVVTAASGEGHLDAATGAGRGVILLTAHLGNWELGGRLLVPRLGRRTHVVLSAEQDRDVERYLRADGPDLRFVTRRHPRSSLALYAALRRREVVAMQGDRPTGDRGDVAVPFFGAPARFPLGPFVLARATGAPVVPAFCVLDGGDGYRIEIAPPIPVGPGGEPAALGRMVAALETAVRAWPTQWFNFFDVWEPR